MATEIEAKVRIEDAAAVERRCGELGAVYGGAWRQLDRFFDHPDRRLLESDSALRMRVSEPLDAAARQLRAPALLTYKGPRQVGRAKVRSEYEVEVTDPDAMTRILGTLDYIETFSYEKQRRLWRLGAVEITVDDVPELGQFVEVEAPDEATVETTFERLGLGPLPRITDSYVRMLFARKP
ncbi:MAG TPA: class IV adenylate cyclase [Phycisphaerae bacterium]|nr:class IV adenylate cyclase [Phycisphaerae bacterium]HOI54345.1 class IV adenylate cyclase [Phycisphaerae bacterium]